VGDALNVIRQQSARTQSELAALKAERDRLLAQLNEASNALGAETQRLQQLNSELERTRANVERYG